MVNLLKRVPETVSVRKELLIAMRHSFTRPEIRRCNACVPTAIPPVALSSC